MSISMSRSIAAIVILVLTSGTVMAQSNLEQLLGSSGDNDLSRLSGDMKAIVLTIDGIDNKLLPGSKLLTGLLATGRGDSYLVEPVSEHWVFADDIRHYSWSGDLSQTDEDIRHLKAQIAGLSEIAKKRAEPFVIVAHSWGSVLAYRAISELWQDGKIDRNAIRKLVTIGSPIDSQSVVAKAASDLHINWAGTQSILEPAQSWTNFWIGRDDVSGPIGELEHNVKLEYSFANPHNAYFANTSLWTRIGEVVAVDLASFEPTVGSAVIDEEGSDRTHVIAAANTADATSNSGTFADEASPGKSGALCAVGVCIGDRLSEVVELGLLGPNPWITKHTSEDSSHSHSGSPGGVPGVLREDGEIDYVCGPATIVAKSQDPNPNVMFLELHFHPKPSGDEWQGYVVTYINVGYKTTRDQMAEFEELVLSKYPGARKGIPHMPYPGIPVQYSRNGFLMLSDIGYERGSVPHYEANANCQKRKALSLD